MPLLQALLQEIVNGLLETGDGEVIAFRLLSKPVGGHALLPHGGGKVKSDHEEKNKDPQHDHQRHAAVVGEFRVSGFGFRVSKPTI